MEHQLIFVYNASSDLFSTITDFAHKILSPSTYDCHLCALTYGNFKEKNEWKNFIENFPVKSIFLHKDEFIKRFKIETALPVVFILSNEEIKGFISKKEIENCASISELKDLITTKYNGYVQHHNTHI
jgi:hypothetical protein